METAAGATGRVHRFEVGGLWTQQEGRGRVELGGEQRVAISVPAAFGGRVPGGNPEELLLAAALACYLMTLGRLLAARGMGDVAVEGRIAGEVRRGPAGLRFERIRLQPRVRVAGWTAEARTALDTALQDAEAACFIAQTLRPVIAYELEPVYVE